MVFRSIMAMCLPIVVAGETRAACPQELAVYLEAGGSASVEFRPVGPEASGSVANRFRLLFADTGLMLDGFVIWNNGVSRPNGIVTHACPDGDATGEELDACTIWTGVLYTVDADGEVDLLPPQGNAAASTIIFPDLGRAIRYSMIYGAETDTIPWDVFTLSGCQE